MLALRCLPILSIGIAPASLCCLLALKHGSTILCPGLLASRHGSTPLQPPLSALLLGVHWRLGFRHVHRQ